MSSWQDTYARRSAGFASNTMTPAEEARWARNMKAQAAGLVTDEEIADIRAEAREGGARPPITAIAQKHRLSPDVVSAIVRRIPPYAVEVGGAAASAPPTPARPAPAPAPAREAPALARGRKPDPARARCSVCDREVDPSTPRGGIEAILAGAAQDGVKVTGAICSSRCAIRATLGKGPSR